MKKLSFYKFGCRKRWVECWVTAPCCEQQTQPAWTESQMCISLFAALPLHFCNPCPVFVLTVRSVILTHKDFREGCSSKVNLCKLFDKWNIQWCFSNCLLIRFLIIRQKKIHKPACLFGMGMTVMVPWHFYASLESRWLIWRSTKCGSSGNLAGVTKLNIVEQFCEICPISYHSVGIHFVKAAVYSEA